MLEEQQREMQVAHESEMEAIRARAGAEEHAAAEQSRELEVKLDAIHAALDAETLDKSRLLEEQESEMRSAHASEVEALEGRAGAEEQAAAERARVLEE